MEEKQLAKKWSGLPRGSVAFSVASVSYLLLMHFLTGLRAEHGAIIAAMNLLFYLGPGTRRFILGFAIFAVFGMLYDVMRAFPNYLYNTVDIGPLYLLEKRWFGIDFAGARLTPNEFCAANATPAADLVAGIFYINWMPVPLAFAVWLYFHDRKMFLNFSLTFLFVNLLGFAIYYLHPAAPPWYVSRYGFTLDLHTPGSAAGLSRFDDLVGLNIFGSIYTKNSNVFAAIPSLHCAYPVVVLWYGIRSRCGWVNILLAVFMLGIWYAAVYSGHHYVIDAILGVVCAVAGILIYERVLLRWGGYRRFVERYAGAVSCES